MGPWGGGTCLRGNERLGVPAGLGCPWGSKWVPGSHLGGEAEHTDGERVGVCEWHMAGDGWHGNSMWLCVDDMKKGSMWWQVDGVWSVCGWHVGCV